MAVTKKDAQAESWMLRVLASMNSRKSEMVTALEELIRKTNTVYVSENLHPSYIKTFLKITLLVNQC